MKAKTKNTKYLEQQYVYEQKFHKNILNTLSLEDRQKLYLEAYDYAYRQSQLYSPKENDFGYQSSEVGLIAPFLFNKNVVDYGCGYGSSSRAIAKFAKHVVGCDILEEVILTAKHRKSKLHTNLDFKTVLPVSFPFENQSIDVVYASDVVEHFHADDFDQWLKSIYKALKPCGKLIVITPHINYGPSDISQHFLIKGSKANGFHLVEYDYNKLIRILKKAGFSNIKTPTISPRHLNYIPYYRQLAPFFWQSPRWRIMAEQSKFLIDQKFLSRLIGLNRSIFIIASKL